MTVELESINIWTKREGEIVDITDTVGKIVTEGRIRNGVACLFVPGSTAALTTLEYEPGLVEDFPRMLETIIPRSALYEHDKRWRDGNGHSHIRASLIGPDLFIPFRDRKLTLGTWQQIIFVELDIRPRDRTVLLQLVGDS